MKQQVHKKEDGEICYRDALSKLRGERLYTEDSWCEAGPGFQGFIQRGGLKGAAEFVSPIQYNDILSQEPNSEGKRHTLITGSAGTGKSEFAIQLAKFFIRQDQLCFLVPVRRLIKRFSVAGHGDYNVGELLAQICFGESRGWGPDHLDFLPEREQLGFRLSHELGKIALGKTKWPAVVIIDGLEEEKGSMPPSYVRNRLLHKSSAPSESSAISGYKPEEIDMLLGYLSNDSVWVLPMEEAFWPDGKTVAIDFSRIKMGVKPRLRSQKPIRVILPLSFPAGLQAVVFFTFTKLSEIEKPSVLIIEPGRGLTQLCVKIEDQMELFFSDPWFSNVIYSIKREGEKSALIVEACRFWAQGQKFRNFTISSEKQAEAENKHRYMLGIYSELKELFATESLPLLASAFHERLAVQIDEFQFPLSTVLQSLQNTKMFSGFIDDQLKRVNNIGCHQLFALSATERTWLCQKGVSLCRSGFKCELLRDLREASGSSIFQMPDPQELMYERNKKRGGPEPKAPGF